ncbi:9734_t:CDS:2, partial [Funneliformis caledonium]
MSGQISRELCKIEVEHVLQDLQDSNLVSNTKQSILEEDANEPQNYLEKLPPTKRYKKRVRCLVKIS